MATLRGPCKNCGEKTDIVELHNRPESRIQCLICGHTVESTSATEAIRKWGTLHVVDQVLDGFMEKEDYDNFKDEERMLKWFAYEHLPEKLQQISKPFGEMARCLCNDIEPGPERTVALRKLLEAKDAAVRAKLNPGG